MEVNDLRRMYSKLCYIRNEHNITKSTDAEFLFQLKNGLLLELQKRGQLTVVQYQEAFDRLKKSSNCTSDSDD